MAFFATGDTIVANNLVLNLYQHINSPEGSALPLPAAVRGGRARPVLPEPAGHLRPGPEHERAAAFSAVENIPSIARKAEFCFKWIDSIYSLRVHCTTK